MSENRDRPTRTATVRDVLGVQNNMKLYTDAKLKDAIAGYHGMIARPELDAVLARLEALERPWYARWLKRAPKAAAQEEDAA